MRVSRPVSKAAFPYIRPESAPDPALLAVSPAAVRALDLDPDAPSTDEFLQVFSGNQLLDNTRPWALCYAGHQFGLFAGQLGDGRAVSLFEAETPDQRWELQLKGAGRTPYSRFGDGYAVLRSNVKQPETSAIVTRMAPSWLRIGNFEIFYSRNDMNNVRKLADYVWEELFQATPDASARPEENRYAGVLRNVARRTATMVAEWQALGLTIDYGPFQFLDFYDPANICNHSDDAGQYAFKRQPTVCIFNLFKLAVPLFELMGAGDKADTIVFSGEDVTDEATRQAYRDAGKAHASAMLSEEFSDWFMEHLLHTMRNKLGITSNGDDAGDMNGIVIPLLDWATEYHVDLTRFLRSLSDYAVTDQGEAVDAENAKLQVETRDASRAAEGREALLPWLAIYRHRVLQNTNDTNEARRQRMNGVNPRFLLRNWILQEVTQAFETQSEKEATSLLQACLDASLHPFKEKYEDERVERWVTSPVPEVSAERGGGKERRNKELKR
ncbi:hypothetical protein BCR43DRAFT_432197 [Syncephalastrum racemosum]|uniref:Selenoprotein O n=1 Tax=Syncephalastrum racemosum TaxID=13706 RepID=A0A1X2HWD5_SYNRA|nr:hypothetical protein BCR43DRAFT_432197 [Syncephalastrum racemosum]